MGIHQGINLEDALTVAALSGCTLDRDSGEIVVRFPGQKTVRCNARKKSAPRALICLLRRIGAA